MSSAGGFEARRDERGLRGKVRGKGEASKVRREKVSRHVVESVPFRECSELVPVIPYQLVLPTSHIHVCW